MALIKSIIQAGGALVLTISLGAQAAGWQESLSNAASQLSAGKGATEGNAESNNLAGLSALLNGSPQSLSSKSMNNAAGILGYCVKQKFAVASNTDSIKNQLLTKLGLTTPQQQQQTGYQQGLAGLLTTGDGKLLNLNSIGSSALAEKVKAKACDLVLKQGIKFIS
ncbi:DUF2501 domain-containing protein [Dickeya lacustris]|uniref:DUF2501 domain-containing protein n=1 Tax=Dickeya lacustris TaxID=2259638 RepID=A0ABY8G9L1_9GAMM|nr:DUF2501 domain-containing protein [Dickeya lacustris]WFN56559.1 DUF2501 domain-containing protein [Dickeya lacustris]